MNRNPNSNIKQYLFQYGNLFNEWRVHCGGSVSSRESKIELLNYIYIKSVDFYPSLLIIDNDILRKDIVTVMHYYTPNRKEERYIYNILINDDSLKNIIINYDNSDISFISYRMANNIVIHYFLFSFIENFIIRSFLNCCYRIRYTLIDLLNEIEIQYNALEKIAKGEVTGISFFCGIYGLRLEGIEEYNLSENIIIRNINEINNPGISHTIATSTTDKHSNIITGCTLEYKASLQSLGRADIINESYTQDNQFLDKIFDNLVYSHILGLNSIYPPMHITFTDKSLPLHERYPQIITNKSTEVSILNTDKINKVKEWFDLLNAIDTERIHLALNRIKSAIYNRLNPLDSILDAFIAWESMFSSDISTTNSVVKSISRMLERAGYQISKSKLNDLYSLRSSIVHGNPNNHKLVISNDKNNPFVQQEAIKEQTIDIALKVLKELIIDQSLLTLSPRERVELLLNRTFA